MSSRKLKRLIGIDFGTSASVVCYKDYAEDGSTDLNAPTNLAWGLQNSSTVPTLIYSDEEGRKYYGYEADQKGISKPDKLIANFKMNLVNPDVSKRKQAGELLQEFLHFLYEAYERQKTTPPSTEIVEETYISYPAKWPAEIRQITVKAAQTEGFVNVKGMDEPSAAMHYLLSTDTQDIRNLTKAGIIQTGKPLIILLIDMGAGTTDLVLYRYVPGEVSNINVLATWPTVEETATFGGGEIDKILATILKDFLEKHSQPPIKPPLSRLINECKAWKEGILSPSLNDSVTPEEPTSIQQYKGTFGVEFDQHFDISDRTSFGNYLKDYLPTFPQLINGLLAMAEKNGLETPAEQIDLVVLTGGHSQWYFVKEILSGNWVSGLKGHSGSGSGVNLTKIKQEPFRIVTTPRPQETVACGLAMSGVPLKIRKLATNSTWLKLTIGKTDLEPIQIFQHGEIIPAVNKGLRNCHWVSGIQAPIS